MADITITPAGLPFGGTDTVTSTRLNEARNPAAALDAGTIVNADVSATADISGSKLANTSVTFAKLDDVIDDDTMATATNTTLATSESIKAYVDNLALGIKSVSSTTVQTVTDVIPLDNTTPLVTEGTELLSTAFTATDSSNKLLIKFNGLLAGGNTSSGQVMALFRGTSCVGAQWWAQPSSGTNLTQCEFLIDALNTSSNTYSIRYGPGATGLTSYVNTQGNVPGGASLGGFQEIAMTIQEVNSI
jgi:hypothetical protein